MDTLTNRYPALMHCGIGIRITGQATRGLYFGHTIEPVGSFTQTPAQRAGLKSGDMILRIGTPQGLITPTTNHDFNHNLRGPQGSTLELEVLRKDSATPEHLILTRGLIIQRGRNAWEGAIPHPIYDANHRCLMQLSATPAPLPAISGHTRS